MLYSGQAKKGRFSGSDFDLIHRYDQVCSDVVRETRERIKSRRIHCLARDTTPVGKGDLLVTNSTQNPLIIEAVQVLKAGGVAAIPTDTVYGLAARAFDRSAIGKVFDIKGRNSKSPVPLLLGSIDMMEQCIAASSDAVMLLAATCWPGPLTIVVPKSDRVSDELTGGSSTVGLRVPDHDVPRALSQSLGEPITGTSANFSGKPAFTSYYEVRVEMARELDYIFDGGVLPIRPASTVIDLSGELPQILRHGGVSQEAIESALGVEFQHGMV